MRVQVPSPAPSYAGAVTALLAPVSWKDLSTHRARTNQKAYAFMLKEAARNHLSFASKMLKSSFVKQTTNLRSSGRTCCPGVDLAQFRNRGAISKLPVTSAP